VVPALIETYVAAMRVIEEAWPELMAEIADHVRLAVPFGSKLIVGWAYMLFQGAIFIKAVPGDVFFTVERIVHEASHLRLYLMTVVPLHYNSPTDLLPSPFRADPRPVSGLYHAAFVYGRLIDFFRRAAHSTGNEAYAQRAAELISRFDEAVTTLFRRAKLSEVGSRLLEELRDQVY
jgi:HEXXH motif-containing protein